MKYPAGVVGAFSMLNDTGVIRFSLDQLAGLVGPSARWAWTMYRSVGRPGAGVLLRRSKYVTATTPSWLTATDGRNACRLPVGMFSGVWLILIGVDQVKPPSVDIEEAM